MKNRQVGFIIIGIAVVFFFVVMSYNNALQTITEQTCTMGETCPMHITIKTQEAISYSLMGLLVAVGILIAYFIKDEKIIERKVLHKPEKLSSEELNGKIADLDEEEKQLIQIVMREEGSAYQSDLIKETKLSKVKVSRLLDRLEGKGLIERKRRGMTNVVILKS